MAMWEECCFQAFAIEVPSLSRQARTNSAACGQFIDFGVWQYRPSVMFGFFWLTAAGFRLVALALYCLIYLDMACFLFFSGSSPNKLTRKVPDALQYDHFGTLMSSVLSRGI